MKIVGVCPPAINGHGRCYYWWSVRPRSASILYFMLPVHVCVYIRSHCTCMCHTHSIPTCDTFQGQRARFHASQGFFPSGEVHWSPHRQGGVCVCGGGVGGGGGVFYWKALETWSSCLIQNLFFLFCSCSIWLLAVTRCTATQWSYWGKEEWTYTGHFSLIIPH